MVWWWWGGGGVGGGVVVVNGWELALVGWELALVWVPLAGWGENEHGKCMVVWIWHGYVGQ